MAKPVRTVVKPDAQSKFLLRVAKRFQMLLEREPDKAEQIREAGRRMEAADLIYQPIQTSSPAVAAWMLFENNPLLLEVWMEVQEQDYWKRAETPMELVSAFLPNPDSLA